MQNCQLWRKTVTGDLAYAMNKPWPLVALLTAFYQISKRERSLLKGAAKTQTGDHFHWLQFRRGSW